MKNIEDMSDAELIDSLRQESNSGECLMELVSRHSGIYMTMVHNYTPSATSSTPTYKSELISDKNYYIYQAALKYDESKNTKFSTYLGNETRWMCLNLYNKTKNKSAKEIEIDKPEMKDIPEEENENEKSITKEFLDKVMSIASKDPDPRILRIFKMRYMDPGSNKVTPWKQIGDSLQLSIQGCINIHNKAITKIKKELSRDI